MQMPSVEVSPVAQSQHCSQMFEVNDALRHHMLPYLGLHNIMQLVGTCRAWRQLIADTTSHHLSQEARQAVLPSGLTSSLPLLHHLKQQAQLLTRMRGKHDFTPGIQHLSFGDELLAGTQQGNAQRSRSVPMPLLQVQTVYWSPCTCLEEPSQWLALDPEPDQDQKLLPIVINMATGQQVSFEPGPMSMRVSSVPSLHAAWLTGRSDQILMFPSTAKTSESIAWLADAQGQSILPISLPGAQFKGFSRFFTVLGEHGALLDILCWVRQSEMEGARCFDDQISVFNASSRLLMYQLSCPQQLHKKFLKLQTEGDSHATTGPQASSGSQLQNGALGSRQLLLSPKKKLLAVVWQFYLVMPSRMHPVVCTGLSIHSAMTGDLCSSKLLTRATSGEDRNCQPSWLPCSSNLLYVSDGGLLNLITSSGCKLWSNARADRYPIFRPPARHNIDTSLNASPCRRWILVMDDEAPQRSGGVGNRTGHITVVEALTGRNLADFHSHRSISLLDGSWSMSGDICLLEQLDRVLVYCPQARPPCKVFQQCELLSRPTPYPMLSSIHTSLSPYGRTVVDLGNLSAIGLQHWQIPPSPAIVKEAAAGSAPKIWPRSVSGNFQVDRVTNASRSQEAWHPLSSACVYAMSCLRGGVHIVDAKAHRCVRSWSTDDLHGPAMLANPIDANPTEAPEGVLHPHHADEGDDADDDGNEDHYTAEVPHILSWSQDGSRLAVASGASLTRGAKCSVLHFSDSST